MPLDEDKNDLMSRAYEVFRLGFQRKKSTGAESDTKSVDQLLQNVQQSKVEPLEPDEVEAELIIKDVIRRAFEMIVAMVTDIVADSDTRIYSESAILTINELTRYFHLRIEITKFGYVALIAEFEVKYDQPLNNKKYIIAEKMIDCCQECKITETDILLFFSDIFQKRFKLYDEIIKKQKPEDTTAQEIVIPKWILFLAVTDLLEKLSEDVKNPEITIKL